MDYKGTLGMHKLGVEMHLDLHGRSQELHRAAALLGLRGGHVRVPTVTLTSHRRGLTSGPDQYGPHGPKRKVEGKTWLSRL